MKRLTQKTVAELWEIKNNAWGAMQKVAGCLYYHIFELFQCDDDYFPEKNYNSMVKNLKQYVRDNELDSNMIIKGIDSEFEEFEEEVIAYAYIHGIINSPNENYVDYNKITKELYKDYLNKDFTESYSDNLKDAEEILSKIFCSDDAVKAVDAYGESDSVKEVEPQDVLVSEIEEDIDYRDILNHYNNVNFIKLNDADLSNRDVYMKVDGNIIYYNSNYTCEYAIYYEELLGFVSLIASNSEENIEIWIPTTNDRLENVIAELNTDSGFYRMRIDDIETEFTNYKKFAYKTWCETCKKWSIYYEEIYMQKKLGRFNIYENDTLQSESQDDMYILEDIVRLISNNLNVTRIYVDTINKPLGEILIRSDGLLIKIPTKSLIGLIAASIWREYGNYGVYDYNMMESCYQLCDEWR